MLLPVITLISFIISLNHSVWIWFHHSVNFCVQKIGFVHLDTGLRIFKIFYAAFFGHHVEHKLNGNEIYSFLSDLPQHNNVRWYSCAVLTSFPQFEGRKFIRPDRCQCFRDLGLVDGLEILLAFFVFVISWLTFLIFHLFYKIFAYHWSWCFK